MTGAALAQPDASSSNLRGIAWADAHGMVNGAARSRRPRDKIFHQLTEIRRR